MGSTHLAPNRNNQRGSAWPAPGQKRFCFQRTSTSGQELLGLRATGPVGIVYQLGIYRLCDGEGKSDPVERGAWCSRPHLLGHLSIDCRYSSLRSRSRSSAFQPIDNGLVLWRLPHDELNNAPIVGSPTPKAQSAPVPSRPLMHPSCLGFWYKSR